MRIWQQHELGDPGDKLRLEEVPDPEVSAGKALIKIEAVGLAFPNVLQCRGEYQVPTTLPYSPGMEMAGTVLEVGDGVNASMVGQRVVAMGGGLAERAVLPASGLYPVPDGVALDKAAALPVNYGTTWFALHDRGQLQPGETLLVTGAAGGVGTAAIQLGKAAGARVIAVAGGAKKVEVCRELGADEVIDHREVEDLVTAVRELTDGKGVDVAYEAVGGDVAQWVRRTMAWDGRLLIIGFAGGTIPDLPANHILLKNYSVVGVHWGASIARDPESLGRQLGEVFALCASGEVDPPLYPAVAFEDSAAALQDLADRKTWAKVVVTVA